MVGDLPRSDRPFVDANVSGRSPSEELFEGVLVAAAETYEERKLPFLGFLYASFAFDSTVSPPRAHQLLTLAKRLTYRQLVVLGAFATRTWEERGPLSSVKFLGPDEEALSFLTEMLALVQEGLAYSTFETGRLEHTTELGIVDTRETHVASTPDEVEPLNFRVSPAGRWLVQGMRLDLIPSAEFDDVARALRR